MICEHGVGTPWVRVVTVEQRLPSYVSHGQCDAWLLPS